MFVMDTNDTALVAEAKKGDHDSFRRLVDRHSLAIFRVAYRICGNEQDAEDIVQETFVKAYRNLPGFDHRSAFSTWLYRIAVNNAIDWTHKHPPWEMLQEEMPAGKGNDPAGFSLPDGNENQIHFRLDMQSQVKAAFGVLTPMERAAFILRHFEEKPIEEVADVLGLRNGAAKNSIFRAVRKMRRILAPFAGRAL